MADPIRVRAEMNKGQKVHLLEYDAPIRVPDGTIKMLPFLREVPDPNEGTTVDPLGYAIVALHNLYQEKCQEITYLKRELAGLQNAKPVQVKRKGQVDDG